MNSFSFFMSENAFILFSLLKDLVAYRIQMGSFFPHYFKDPLSFCLHFFCRKSSVIPIFAPLCVTSLSLFLASFKIFFLSLILNNMIMIWLDDVLVSLSAWVCWISSIPVYINFIKAESFLTSFFKYLYIYIYLFLKPISPSCFRASTYIYIGLLKVVPQLPMLCSYFLNSPFILF